jgi:hypothetical protein
MNKRVIIFILIIIILITTSIYFIKNKSIDESCSLVGSTIPIPNEICCEGLKPLYGGDYLEECVAFEDTGLSICTPCGNGICDTEYENKCNCPEDCK